jgi:hypothetical protein
MKGFFPTVEAQHDYDVLLFFLWATVSLSTYEFVIHLLQKCFSRSIVFQQYKKGVHNDKISVVPFKLLCATMMIAMISVQVFANVHVALS